MKGNVNGWGSRYTSLFLGFVPLLLIILFQYLPKIDPKKESYHKHQKAFTVLNLISVLIVAAFQLLLLFYALGYDIHFHIIVPILLFLLFVILGNYTTQLRPNYFMGIRTPWTLASEMVWRKTHRFGGVIFIILGFLSLLMLLDHWGPRIFMGGLILAILLIYAYSYVIYRKLQK